MRIARRMRVVLVGSLAVTAMGISGTWLQAQDAPGAARPVQPQPPETDKPPAGAPVDPPGGGAYEPAPPQPAGPDCLDAVPVCVKNPNVNVNVTNAGMNVAVTNRPGVRLQGITPDALADLNIVLQDQTDQVRYQIALTQSGFLPIEVYVAPGTTVFPWADVLPPDRYEISYIHIENVPPNILPPCGSSADTAENCITIEYDCGQLNPCNTGMYRTVGNTPTSEELTGYLYVWRPDTVAIKNWGGTTARVKLHFRLLPVAPFKP